MTCIWKTNSLDIFNEIYKDIKIKYPNVKITRIIGDGIGRLCIQPEKHESIEFRDYIISKFNNLQWYYT